MLEFFTELQLNYGYLIRPLIVGTLVSIVCSVIGCFIVLRRMSFLADAIAHSMLARCHPLGNLDRRNGGIRDEVLARQTGHSDRNHVYRHLRLRGVLHFTGIGQSIHSD